MKEIENVGEMVELLRRDLFDNAIFIHRVMISGSEYRCFADGKMKAFVGVEANGENVVFTGNWNGVRMPVGVLPEGGFFTPGCHPGILEKVGEAFEIEEAWPCWRYVADKPFPPGPWDGLDRLREEDVPFISKYWTLVENPEERLREKVRMYESACLREGAKPIAWAGVHFEVEGLAELGFAHTLEEHRGKGLALLVTKAMVNRVFAKDNIPVCHMFKDNVASINLCEKAGLRRNGEATWASVGKRL